MGSNGVVSIRVEGVSITIVDGNITIEQTKTEIPAAGVAPEVEVPAANRAHVRDLMAADACAPNGAVPASAGNGSTEVLLSESADDSGLDAQTIALVTNPPPGKNGPPWSAQELKQLRALYPTHSARAIAAELGRPFNSVRSKAQKLGLKRPGPPKVTKSAPGEAKPAPKPKSLSAAATVDVASVSKPPCAAVPLLEHQADMPLDCQRPWARCVLRSAGRGLVVVVRGAFRPRLHRWRSPATSSAGPERSTSPSWPAEVSAIPDVKRREVFSRRRRHSDALSEQLLDALAVMQHKRKCRFQLVQPFEHTRKTVGLYASCPCACP